MSCSSPAASKTTYIQTTWYNVYSEGCVLSETHKKEKKTGWHWHHVYSFLRKQSRLLAGGYGLFGMAICLPGICSTWLPSHLSHMIQTIRRTIERCHLCFSTEPESCCCSVATLSYDAPERPSFLLPQVSSKSHILDNGILVRHGRVTISSRDDRTVISYIARSRADTRRSLMW